MKGSTLVEVLVALVLVALAGGGLAAVATMTGRALVAARADAAATALAGSRLETLRAGPRANGADATVDAGLEYARRWAVVDGRGRPDAVDVHVAWSGHDVGLATEVAP